MFLPAKEQLEIIKSGTIEVLPEEELLQKLEKSIKTNKPLTVKLGCDPSRPDLHLGHAVVLHKLRQFQDLGHQAILIVGDFTAMIGDPTGKSKTRPSLTMEETKINGQSYFEQAGKILDVSKLRVAYNSEWLNKMTFSDVIALSAKYTVAQILERDDFSKRYKAGEPISIHEFMYPLAQAMDSVAIESDIELGGTDQKFNLLVGRELQKAYGKEPQCILTMPILEGLDGVEKMSKSLNNYIGLTDEPREMFGKAMSIPDNHIIRYYRYAAQMGEADIAALQAKLDGGCNPRDAKVEMGKAIVSLYWGKEAGDAALEEFERIFKNKDLPDVIEELEIDGGAEQNIVEILAISGMAPTKNEARRLIQGGGVSVDGEKIADFKDMIDISEFKLFKVGKRKFLRIKGR